MKYKKGDFVAVMTNQPEVHFSWMVDCGMKSEDVKPSEYVAKIKSVIGDCEAYFIFIPNVGFRCVVDASEVLRRVPEDELTDDERNHEDDILFTAPNLYVRKEDHHGVNNEGRFLYLAMAATTELYPEDKVVSVELCRSDYLKSDMLATIDHLIEGRKKKSHKLLKKREQFKEMLERLRFKEYYDVRVGVEDELDEGATYYIYLAVDTACTEVYVRKDMYSDGQRFYYSLGPEYDSVHRFYIDLRREILSSK
jgi:hypothetical protein